MNTLWVKIRGSHKTEAKIVRHLGRSPSIHSGMAGRGAFCCYVTQIEFDSLKEAGFKISLRVKT